MHFISDTKLQNVTPLGADLRPS